MDADNETFTEWLESEEYLPSMASKIEEKTFTAIVDALAQDDQVFESYYEYRKDDVVQGIIDEASNEPDYDTRDEDRDYWLENEPD